MLKCKTVGSEQWAFCRKHARSTRVVFVLLLTAHCLLVTVSCRQDMQDQPKMKPLRGSSFFRDGLSARPLVAGTVPRGFLKADTELFTGKRIKTPGATSAQTRAAQAIPKQAPAGPQPVAIGSTVQGAAAYPDDIDTFPFPVSEDIVKRGKERYEIFCSACHGGTGYGDGMIVRRGFRRAASFHDDRLRQAPVGHFFDAISNGWGAMPSYASQIPVQDRWAIIAYIRALQFSQQNPQSQLPPAQPATRQLNEKSGGRQKL